MYIFKQTHQPKVKPMRSRLSHPAPSPLAEPLIKHIEPIETQSKEKNRYSSGLISNKSGVEMQHTDPGKSFHPDNLDLSLAETLNIAAPNDAVNAGEIADFNRSNRGRIAVFIDGSNLFYAALEIGVEIDYLKLLCYLTDGSPLLRCFFYTGVDPTNEKQHGFLYWMRRHGYRLITKDIIQLPDGSRKGNLDVEIAVDMVTLADYYDTAILVSGDGDLAYAVNAVSYRGARVEVVGLRSMTSESLLNVADRYIDLDTIKEDIQKSSGGGYNHRSLSGTKLTEAIKDETKSNGFE